MRLKWFSWISLVLGLTLAPISYAQKKHPTLKETTDWLSQKVFEGERGKRVNEQSLTILSEDGCAIQIHDDKIDPFIDDYGTNDISFGTRLWLQDIGIVIQPLNEYGTKANELRILSHEKENLFSSSMFKGGKPSKGWRGTALVSVTFSTSSVAERAKKAFEHAKSLCLIKHPRKIEPF